MSEIITCPICKSENVMSVDNEPLYFPTEKDIKNGMARFDDEIYVKFICRDCKPKNNRFTKIFSLNLKD